MEERDCAIKSFVRAAKTASELTNAFSGSQSDEPFSARTFCLYLTKTYFFESGNL